MIRRGGERVNPENGHPYAEYESNPLWPLLDKGISNLVNNGDLIERTLTGLTSSAIYATSRYLDRQKKRRRPSLIYAASINSPHASAWPSAAFASRCLRGAN